MKRKKKKESGARLSLQRHLYFFLCVDADVAEYFAESLKERVTEGVDVDGVDTADTLDLNQEALDVGHDHPDVQEGHDGKVNTPDECHRDAKDGGQQAVEPVLCHSEGGEAGLPDAVKTVCPFWLCNHIFKINLKGRSDRTWASNRRKEKKQPLPSIHAYVLASVGRFCVRTLEAPGSSSLTWNVLEKQTFGPHPGLIASLGVESRKAFNMFSRCFFTMCKVESHCCRGSQKDMIKFLPSSPTRQHG